MRRAILAAAMLSVMGISGCGESRQTVFTPPGKAEPVVERKGGGEVVEPHNIPMH